MKNRDKEVCVNDNLKNDAVSPVITVLLLLAISVVIAGVVGMVALGLTGDMQNGKQVGLMVASASSGGGDVMVTVVSGKDVPELVKLEVLDGGARDAHYRPVLIPGGNSASSFTAGPEYVAKSVAWPSAKSIGKPYTTPVVVRGTFMDGTEVVLLNTKLTFVGMKLPLESFIKNIYMKSWNGTFLNISIADLFFSGQPVELSLLNLSQTDHQHGLKISVPDDLLQQGTVAKLVMYKLNKDGEIIGGISSNYQASTREEWVTGLDSKTTPVDRVIITVNIYDEKQYNEYRKNYGGDPDYNTNPDLQAPVISSQTGTIKIKHDRPN